MSASTKAPAITAAPTFQSPPPPFPPPPPETSLQQTPVITLNNVVSDAQITTNLYLMGSLGVLCFAFFICFRRGIKLYQTRLYLANVALKPPKMNLHGHRLLWSWLVPIFTVSDHDMIRSCGLDSLMIVRVAQLGTQLFFPTTVLGCIALLPMYTKQTWLDQQHSEGKVASPSTAFSRATMSNIPRGSALFWVPFVYVYIVLIYASWLLRRHYREYARLRTQYIIAGEVTANDWHEAFLTNSSGRTIKRMLSDNGYRSRGASSTGAGRDPDIVNTTPFRRMFSRQERQSDPGDVRGDDWMAELSTHDVTPSSPMAGDESVRALSVCSRPDIEAVTADMPLLQRLANRRHERSAAPGMHKRSRDGSASPAIVPFTSRQSASLDGVHRTNGDTLPQEEHPSKGKSFLERTAGPFTINPAAGLASYREKTHGDDGNVLPNDRATCDTAPDNVMAPPSAAASPVMVPQSRASPSPSNYVEQVFNQQAALALQTEMTDNRLPTSNSFRSVATSPPSEIVMNTNGSNNAGGKATGDTSSQAGGGSKLEPEQQQASSYIFAGQTVYKWWKGERDIRGNVLSGKPNVWARKVVNTVNEDGATVGVMAQQYVVLVEGVPDPQDAVRAEWRGTTMGHVLEALKAKRRQWHAKSVTKAETAAAKKQAKMEQVAVAKEKESAAAADLAEEGRNGGGGEARMATVPPKSASADTRHIQASRDADEQLRMLATAVSLPALDGSPSRNRRRTARHSRGASGDPFASQQPDQKNLTSEQPDAANDTDAFDGDLALPLTTRQEVVNEFFTYLFPGSFQIALPVLEHKAVDLLLYQWDTAASKLEIAEAQYVASEMTSRPTLKVGGCCCFGGQQVDAINHWADRVRDLETQVGEARQAALRSAPTASFFVFFNDQAAAATAAQVSLQSEDGREFRVSQAPGPEEVNWPTLWKSFGSRNMRRLLVLIPLAGMIIFPIGIFAGSISQLSLLLCGSASSTAKTGIRWNWYCTGDNYLRKVVTGVLPPLILTFWQGIVVPRWFYYWCQAERRAQSFTKLDQRILGVFFWWSVICVFIGAMLGGSIFSQFRVVLANPGRIPYIIGTALPTSSNFFINYVIVQSLAIIPFRFMFPHMGIFPWVFRACGFNKSLTERQGLDKLWPHSARGSKEIAFMILIFVIGLAYAAVSPIILPVALLYFCLSWSFWRYAVLYFFERCYESGGRLFEKVFSQVVFCLFIFEAFTAAVFFANSAWYQGSILLVTTTLYLYEFHKWTVAQFVATKFVPLESAIGAPLATVDPLMYIPPALRHGCAGWYPEVGKAWEAWNAAVYTI